jgi:anti-anti-sigma factor
MAGLEHVNGDHAPDGARARVERHEDLPESVVVRVCGEVDLASVPALQATVDQAIEHNPHKIFFDLSGVRFMDSSGIALLLTVARKVDAVELTNPSTIVRRVIELAGLTTALPMTS